MRFIQGLLSGVIPAIVLAMLAGAAAAQSTEKEEALLRRIEALDQKIEELERRLGNAPPSPREEALKQRVDDIDQQVRIVGRKQEIEQEAAAARAKDGPQAVAGRDGFGVRTADNQFAFRLRGYLQADARVYDDEAQTAAPDTFTLRRVRPIFEGTLFGKYGFRFMPDFGQGSTQIFDAHGDANFNPAFRVRVGKFKPGVGLERLQSATALSLVERALPTNLVPTRDIGVQVSGDLLENRLTYELGVFNGVVDGGQATGGSGDRDSNSGKDVAARLFAHPFRASETPWLQGLGLGVAVTWGEQQGTATNAVLPAFVTPGQQTFFSYSAGAFADGERTRFAPQFYWYWQTWGLLGEYYLNNQRVRRGANVRDVDVSAWQLTLNWVLTGEDASFGGVRPRQPFDPAAGGWGAFELVGRAQQLEVDDAAFAGTAATRLADPSTAARKATGFGLGLNWYLNRAVKVQAAFERTRFDGGAANGGDRRDENVFFTRYQVSF